MSLAGGESNEIKAGDLTLRVSPENLDSPQHDSDKVLDKSPNCRYLKLNTIMGKGSYKVVWKAMDTEEGIEVAWNCFQVFFSN